MAVSEVAQLRQRIADEYVAAQWGLSGLAYGTSRHLFITKRMECIQQQHELLQNLVGESAIALIAQTLETLPEQQTRDQLPAVLRHELGQSAETTLLIERIQALWETLDLLAERFGQEAMQKILTAPARTIPAS